MSGSRHGPALTEWRGFYRAGGVFRSLFSTAILAIPLTIDDGSMSSLSASYSLLVSDSSSSLPNSLSLFLGGLRVGLGDEVQSFRFVLASLTLMSGERAGLSLVAGL